MRVHLLLVCLLLTVTADSFAQGPGFRGGRGPGRAGDMAADRDTFHALLDQHDAIERAVEEIPGGVQTVTTSDDPAVVAKLREHVHAMHQRLLDGRPVRMWDPLFREVFASANQIAMEVTEVPGGVEVRETSDDARVVALIRAHSKVVSGFVAEGFAEAHRSHDPPKVSAEPEQAADWVSRSVAFDRVYIPALALTNQLKERPSLVALKRLAKHVQGLEANGLFADVAPIVTEAQRLAEAGELQAAHETLEPIRDLLAERRRAAGVDYPLDPLAEFHAVMEAIVKPAAADGGPDGAWLARLPDLAAEASSIWARVEQTSFTDFVAEGDVTSTPRRDGLLSAERAALTALNQAIRSGDREKIIAAARAVKPPFAKLYVSFGDLSSVSGQ